jgi:hypothetical protein
MHRVRAAVHCRISNIMYVMYPQQRPCLTVYLFQENKSFGESLHSSSDVREVVSRTIRHRLLQTRGEVVQTVQYTLL